MTRKIEQSHSGSLEKVLRSYTDQSALVVIPPQNGNEDEAFDRAITWLHANGYSYDGARSTTDVMVPANVHSPELYLAGKFLIEASNHDVVYFCKGWQNSRICTLKYQLAVEAGLRCIYETEDEPNGK